MSSLKATLFLDFGNSETRLKVQANGQLSDIYTLSNQFAAIPSNYNVPENYRDDSSASSLVFRSPDAEGNVQLFANGLLVKREFPNYVLKPTGMRPKYEAITTPLTVQAALAVAYGALHQITGENADDLDVEWSIVALLPPIQVDRKERLIEKIKSVKQLSVTFPRKLTKDINIASVRVVPEGIAGFFAVAFNQDKSLRPGMGNLKDSSILIMDVGAGTTDVCLVQNFSAIDDTKDTFPTGGINVERQVGKYLKADGYNVLEDRLSAAVVRGSIKDGNSTIDLTEQIDLARKKVAQNLQGNVRKTFETSMFDPRGIEYLLVTGGGALPSTTTSLGEHLLHIMKELSPNIELLEIPEDLNIRHLNLIGSTIMVG